MRLWPVSILIVVLAAPGMAFAAGDYASLLPLAEGWRRFEQPAVKNCVPDYGSAAMTAKAAALPDLVKGQATTAVSELEKQAPPHPPTVATLRRATSPRKRGEAKGE